MYCILDFAALDSDPGEKIQYTMLSKSICVLGETTFMFKGKSSPREAGNQPPATAVNIICN